MFGKITLPTAKDGFTDDTGKVRIDGMYVFVNDENGAIENAFVKLNDDDTISVTLPDGTSIDYANRITVTVTDKDGNPLKGISVTVSDTAGNSQTDKTDENGKMVVPPLSEDITDENGVGKVNGYNVVVTDEKAPIANAFITISEDGRLSVKLPEANKIDIENRISVVVTDNEDKPVKGMTVAITETAAEGEAKAAVDVTDENGKVTVPPTTIDYTDINGTANIKDYTVIVEDTKSKIEKAFVTLNEDGTISVLLPENLKIEHSNRITVTVLDKDGNGVKNISVTVKENIPETSETETENKVEAKIAVGVTDKDGKVIVPPASEGITDKDGKTDISETIPGKDTDGDGKEDTEETKTIYNILVEDTKGKIENAYIEIKDGKITVTLPDTHTLTTSNQTTVTVLDKVNKGVANVSVTVTDKNKTTATKSTDTNGKITVPVKSTGGGSSSGGGGGRGGSRGGSYINSNITNITVTNKSGKTVSVSKSTDKDGKITLTLPNGANLTGDNYYTIKATDNKGNAKAEISIVLKDKKNNTANGTTDKNGMLILPGSKHKAYIMGYPDGSFRPDGDMSRAEAAAIFARLIADKKNESVNGTPSFKDTPNNKWYSAFVGYLEKYNIISGYEDGTFRPDESITRAEFVTIAVRYYSLFNEVKSVSNTTKYNDLSNNYWAIKNISYATSEKWLNGYSDGSFRPDIVVTRAEVVTIINRATGRNADTEFINKNLTVLNRFTDVKNNSHWAAYDIFEASNDHTGITSGSNEIWSK